MKKILFALMVLLLIGSGIAFVVLRPQLDQPATEGTINAKGQASTATPVAQQPRVSDGPAPTVVPPTQNAKAAVPQLPDPDWIPESWPLAIERINAALQQRAETESIANPEKQRLRVDETNKELSNAISQFPSADSTDLYIPLFVRAFVSANSGNRERQAFEAMTGAFAGGGNLSAFDTLGLQKIADEYGSFAICDIGSTKASNTPTHKLLGSQPPAMEILVVAGAGSFGDLAERATFIKKELWMSAPFYGAFVFLDSLDDGEFAKLEPKQQFWLRVAFGAPSIITRIAPGQDVGSLMAGGGEHSLVTQVVGFAPRSMNSNTQRAIRAKETTVQAVRRVAETQHNLAIAREQYDNNVNTSKQEFVRAVTQADAFDNPQLAERAFHDILELYKDRILKNGEYFGNWQVTFLDIPKPSSKDMQRILRFVVLNRIHENNRRYQQEGGIAFAPSYYHRQESIPDFRSTDIRNSISNALQGQEYNEALKLLVADVSVSLEPSKPRQLRKEYLIFQRPEFERDVDSKGHQMSPDIVAQIDAAIVEFVKVHGWVEKEVKARAVFRQRVGVEP